MKRPPSPADIGRRALESALGRWTSAKTRADEARASGAAAIEALSAAKRSRSAHQAAVTRAEKAVAKAEKAVAIAPKGAKRDARAALAQAREGAREARAGFKAAEKAVSAAFNASNRDRQATKTAERLARKVAVEVKNGGKRLDRLDPQWKSKPGAPQIPRELGGRAAPARGSRRGSGGEGGGGGGGGGARFAPPPPVAWEDGDGRGWAPEVADDFAGLRASPSTVAGLLQAQAVALMDAGFSGTPTRVPLVGPGGDRVTFAIPADVVARGAAAVEKFWEKAAPKFDIEDYDIPPDLGDLDWDDSEHEIGYA